MATFRDQLVGAWELVEYQAYSADDRSNTIHPMGKNAEGIIMYTPDGYMSAQLQTPGVPSFDPPGTDDNWAEVGRVSQNYSISTFSRILMVDVTIRITSLTPVASSWTKREMITDRS